MCTVTLNNELNGIELSFESKPQTEILSLIKESGFRWHNVKKIWYAKQNEKTLLTAQKLSDEEIDTNNTITKPEQIERTEAYYPSYSEVGSTEIFKNSDVSIISKQGGYFADINAYIWMYYGQVKIIDLTNALSIGKTCKTLSININDDRNNTPACELHNNGFKTYKDVYEKFFVRGETEDYKVYPNEEKSINTFSPFVEIKPIKTPKKWNLSHIWKAILSGQIYKGVVDGKYSDDYAYDAAYGYFTGSSFGLIKFAKDLIESPSGWHCYVDKEDGNKVQLSVNCHSFDLRTVYFDENCNHEEKEKRQQEDVNEKTNHNQNLLNEVIDLKKDDIVDNTIYQITYLDMNDNTKLYEKKTKLVYSSQIFYEDEHDYIECNYKITELNEVIPDNYSLYSISDFYNRPYGEKYQDKRVIDMGNWEHIVTGYALKELIAEGNIYATIHKSEFPTIENAKVICENHITGTMSWMFGVCDTDYKQSLFRLNAEELRIKDDDVCLVL